MRSHFAMSARSITLVASFASARVLSTDVPDYGFPRCFSSFESYDSAFFDTRANHEVRLLTGHRRFPYVGASDTECDATEDPLIALGPHWSPLGLTRYVLPDDCGTNANCLPLANGTLVVASHGSWNRSPFIGYRVHAYAMDDDYGLLSQSTVLPPMRHSVTGLRLRPVDVRTSPTGDGALLMTADRDDLDSDSNGGGGLYRIRGGTNARDYSDSGSTIATVPFATQLNALGENPAGVTLERLASIPCARQMALAKSLGDYFLFVSSFGGFCPAGGFGDKIWVMKLHPDNGHVVGEPVVMIQNLNGPQGIDVLTEEDYTTTLFIATTGQNTVNKGNSVLRVPRVEQLARAALGINAENEIIFPINGGSDTQTVQIFATGFTRTQRSHAWRSLRVDPTNSFLVVTVGADCNWSSDCHDNASINDYQTTLLRIDLKSKQVSLAARGIRNSIGLYFDTYAEPKGKNLLFTSFGSDRAAGVPGATSANNVPDCTVELLRFADDDSVGDRTFAPSATVTTDVEHGSPSASPSRAPTGRSTVETSSSLVFPSAFFTLRMMIVSVATLAFYF